MLITFVILHYLAINDTIECVDSILKNVKYENYNIIIVDNNSPNKSGDSLEKIYLSNKKVYVIKNSKNLGFANGNNVGYKYAKYELNSDFIILLNNDTKIEQNDFLELIIRKYQNIKFHILGPDIVSLINGKHQNPVKREFYRINDVNKRIYKLKLLLILNYFNLDIIAQKITKLIKHGESKLNNKSTVTNDKNIQLHGSCIVFSPIYVSNYDGLYDKTFLYYEENILRYIADRDNLKIFYYDGIKIYHKEDASTNMLIKSKKLKRKFYYKNSINSCKLLRKMMMRNN